MSSAKPHTVLDLIQVTQAFFHRNRVESPRLEAEMLLAHVLGIPRIQLYVRFNQPLTETEVSNFRELVRRRSRHEPVHYILGSREFWGLDFDLEPGVLIPRPDTECLVEEAIQYLKDHPEATRVADIGTGSGAIAVAVSSEHEEISVWAGDISETALRVAAQNVSKHNLVDRVTVLEANLAAELAQKAGGPFDLILSNPPYISAAAYESLPPHIREWEPVEALTSGPRGFDAIQGLAQELPAALKPGGGLFMEIGYDQGQDSLKLFAPYFEDTSLRQDYAGHDRVVCARGYRGHGAG